MSKALSISELADLLGRHFETEQSSGFQPLDRLPIAISEGLSALAETPVLMQAVAGGIAPRHFAPAPDTARSLNAMPQPSDEDPIRQAWKAGFDNGVATEKRLASETRGENVEAIALLREEIRQIDADALRMLESRMREAVFALCRQVIDEHVIPPDRLAARIESAAAMLAGTHNQKIVEVSRADFDMLGGTLVGDWKLVAIDTLPRGAIRVVSPDGGIEDGPEQWKLALEEAIRTC